MIFNTDEWRDLALLFDSGYPGHKPEVREAPNGDGKIDTEKRYLHVALKYDPPPWAVEYLARAHFEACRVAEALGVPAAYYPRVADGTLRVLDYPHGAGSAKHTDFDLFTILCYRSTPEDLELDYHPSDAGPGEPSPRDDARVIDPHLHVGEIGELCGLGRATPHRVPERPYAQRSIVYFAMPDHAAVLSSGQTVGAWLKERIARSRYA